MVAQEPVKAAIWHSLNSYCYTDAIFIAERLYAEVGNEECLHLLATCFHRAGHVKRTYNLLKTKTFTSIQNKYLFALSCYTLKKYAEAENALIGYSPNMNTSPATVISNEFGNLAGVTLQLLGNIYRKSDVQRKAKECFKQSLKLNPFLWSSFEALCQLGEKIDILDYFKTANSFKVPTQTFPSSFNNTDIEFLSPTNFQTRYNTNMRENLDPSKAIPLLTSTAVIKPPEPNTGGSTNPDAVPPSNRAVSRLKQRIIGNQASSSPVTPSFGLLPQNPGLMETPSSPFITPTVTLNKNTNQMKAPMKLQVKKNFVKSNDQHQSFGTSTLSSNSPASDTENQLAPSLRRSSRLYSGNTNSRESKRTPKVRFNDSTANTCRKTKSRIIKASCTQPLTPTTQNIIQASTKISNLVKESEDLLIKDEKPSSLPSPIQQSTDGLMRLFQDIGKAYQALLLYDCKRAVTLFEDLPYHQLSTSWVMEKLANTYFELGNFELACKAFEKVREYDPYFIDEGMAMYSSLLWLQRKEMLLASLAKDLVDRDQESAISWCAMANCFSSQKEHDSAIKYLERAVQVNPEFAYSYTLLGHEYVATEDYDRALSCYRAALRQNDRHYNAWYGLGMVYYKQEKYILAEQHYERALKINPTNSSLMCNLAVTQNELRKHHQALHTITKAAELNPRNALCRYHKASILLDGEKAEEALKELLELKNLEPKESNIYYLIGKCYQKLGKIHLAQMNFSWALSLEPNGTNTMIKEAMNQQRYQNDSEMLDDEDDITNDMTSSQQIDGTSQVDATEDDTDGIMAIDSTVGTSF